MSTFTEIFSGVLSFLSYVVAPITLIWGWLRWSLLAKSQTLPSMLSLAGFILASASGLLELSTIAYAFAHGFEWYDPVLLNAMVAGLLLSLGALVFGLSGIWKANPLRWHSPVSGLATLAFWLLVAAMQ